jgi:cytochrome b-561
MMDAISSRSKNISFPSLQHHHHQLLGLPTLFENYKMDVVSDTESDLLIPVPDDEEQQDQEDGDYDERLGIDMDEWRRVLLQAQSITLILSHVLALIVLILLGTWISHLGGLPYWGETEPTGHAKLIFNWHPVMMILAFCFMTVSSLCFRYQRLPNRRLAKLCHAVAWTVALVCMSVGLVAVFRSHNDKASGGYIANLYSLHSWVGLTVLTLYLMQFVAGLCTFGLSDQRIGILSFSASSKAKMLQVHRFFGPIIYVSMLLTILLGIQEKEGFIGCGYPVSEPDMVPFQNYSKIPTSCKISHAVSFPMHIYVLLCIV